MKDQLKLLTDAFGLFPDGLMLVDNNGFIIKTNPTLSKVFGFSRDELEGAHINLIIPHRLHDPHNTYINQYHSNPQPRKMGMGLKIKGLRKDQTEIDIDIALAPINADGTPLTLAVIRDISERLKLDRQIISLERTKEELERFGYAISHDLKAPLHQIQSLSQLIALELSQLDKPLVKEMLSRLQESAQSMENLITGVLEYARAGLDENKMMVDLNKILTEVKQTIVIPENFVIETAGRLPILNANYTKILQIFLNLITNAIKYNDKERGRLLIEKEDQRDFYRISFSDNGQVVPENSVKSIFELFHRGKRGEESDKNSHGVGLSIVKKNIEQAGGSIHYEPSKLGGSCFYFLWPK